MPNHNAVSSIKQAFSEKCFSRLCYPISVPFIYNRVKEERGKERGGEEERSGNRKGGEIRRDERESVGRRMEGITPSTSAICKTNITLNNNLTDQAMGIWAHQGSNSAWRN